MEITDQIRNHISMAGKFVLPVLAIVLFVLFVAFAEREQQNTRCCEIDIAIHGEHGAQFIQEEDVLYMLRNKTGHNLIGIPIREVPLEMLEGKLEENHYIKHAEAHISMNGRLIVEIEQRTPVLRVHNNYGEGFYIDRQGRKIPLSYQYTPRVMIASGHIYERKEPFDSLKTSHALDLLKVVEVIQQDPFLESLVAGLYVDRYGEFELEPRIGKQKIILGKAKDLDSKMTKLKAFYKKVLPHAGWNTYKTINLNFENQIVAKR